MVVVCTLICYMILTNHALLVVDNISNDNYLQLVFSCYEPQSRRLLY